MLCDYCSKAGKIVEGICKITFHNWYWNLCEKHLLSEGKRLGISKQKIISFIKKYGVNVNMETKCNNCGETSKIMQDGNGCHTCQKGVMQEVTERASSHS